MMFKKGDEAVLVTFGGTDDGERFTAERVGPKYVTHNGRKYDQSNGFQVGDHVSGRIFTVAGHADYRDRQALPRVCRELSDHDGRAKLTPAAVRNLLAAFRREGLTS